MRVARTLAIVAIVVMLLLIGGCEAASSRSAARAEPTATGPSAVPTPREVVLPYRAYGMAQPVGDELFVTVDSGRGYCDTLMRIAADGERSVVATAAEDIVSVDVNERWVLWEEGETLYARSRATGKTSAVESGREFIAPSLWRDTIAFTHKTPDRQYDMTVMNLETGERKAVRRFKTANYYNNFSHVSNGVVVWTDIYGGTGHYLLYDLTSGRMRDYSVPSTEYRYPGYAMLSGDRVYSINFNRYDEWHWDRQRFGYYSLNDRRFVPLTTSGYINYFCVAGRRLAVIDSEQRLLVGSAPRFDVDVSKRLSRLIDLVNVSADNSTLVAGVSDSESGVVRLYVFDAK